MKKNFRNKIIYVLCLTLMMTGILSLAGCSKAKEDIEEAESKVESVVEEVESKVEDEAEKIKSEAEDLVEEAESKVEDAVEDVKEDAETVIADVKEEFETIVADAKAEAEKIEEVTEDDIHEAIDYIDEHIVNPIENSEVAKKIITYANKLKTWGEQTEEAAKHDIAQLGEKVHDYMDKIINEGEEIEGEAATAVKSEIDKLMETIKADKDALVTEFHNLFSKKD